VRIGTQTLAPPLPTVATMTIELRDRTGSARTGRWAARLRAAFERDATALAPVVPALRDYPVSRTRGWRW
jgi:hypothetical protein